MPLCCWWPPPNPNRCYRPTIDPWHQQPDPGRTSRPNRCGHPAPSDSLWHHPPGLPDWEAELVRLRAAGIRGLKLHPEFQGFALDDPRLFPIFEFMGGEMILLTHVGDRTVTPDNLSTPARVLNIRRNFPFAHRGCSYGGYRMWNEALELLGGKDIYLDISSTMAFIDPALLRRFFSCHGVEHILFGSDYPLFSFGEELTKLERLLPDLSTYDRQRLLGENARELLKLAE